MAVPSEDFRLISAAAVASSTIRVSFTAPPLALSAGDSNDALSPRNYQVSGTSAPVVTLATPVADDPLSIDLMLSAEMITGGTYVLVVSGVKSAAGTALAGTNIISFAATISALPNGGAKASSIVDAIRSFLGTAFRGGSWDSLAYALAAGDEQVAQTARDVFEQLYLSTASGKYLDRLAGERGVIRPVGVGMSDDSFRRLAIALTTKVTHNALWEILEIFFGAEAVRGVLEAGVDEPYALNAGDQLLLSFGDGVVYPIAFETSSFTTISNASALEIVGAINERLRSLGSSAWAMPTLNPETNAYRVTLFSPGVGTGSSVEVVGGKAQGALRFPEVIDCALPIGTALSVAVPSLGTAEYTISGMTTAPLEAVREGDYVHLSAPALNTLNQGSFRVESVEVEWTGASYSQRFTVTNTQAVVQTGPLLTTSDSDLIFWRRGSGTLPARRAEVITADDNQVLIEVPATTAVVERSQESAAYLPPVDSFEGTFERRVDGDVLVDLTSAHGMSAGDWVYIGSAVPDMVIAPVTAGDVSIEGLPGTTSTSQRTIVDQIRSPDGIAARWGNTLTTMPNGKVLILGGLAEQAAPLPSDYWHVSDGNYSSNKYLPQLSSGGGSSTYSTTTNVARAAPFFVGRQGRTVTAIGVYFSSAPAAGRVLKLAIYDCLPASQKNCYPQNLVASVSFTPSATAGVQFANLASPVDLPNGLYWIAIGQGTASSLQIFATNSTGENSAAGRNPLQWTTTTPNSMLSVALSDASAFPATFPAGATMVSLSIPLFEVL